MEPTRLGLILDSSIIIAAERRGQTVTGLLVQVKDQFGEIEVAISAVTVAELVHGFARATSDAIRDRRRSFIDELKRHVPVLGVTANTAEVAGLIGGDQAARGVSLPLDDLLIAACAIEQGYAVVTLNERHFRKIPGLEVVAGL